MAKKKAKKPQRVFTRHQLSRWQQQKRRQRIIFGLGIFIITAVIGIIGVGWYIDQYKPMHQIVIRVNDTEFDMQYYVKMLEIHGNNQSDQYLQYLPDQVVKMIEENELVTQGALKLGISVSDDAITEEIKKDDLPNNNAYRDLIEIRLLIDELQEEFFDQQVPLSAHQRHFMAMLLESEVQAMEVRARLENGESFTEIAGELSVDPLSKNNEGDFGWYAKEVLNELLDTSLVDHVFNAQVDVLGQPVYDEETDKWVGYWLIQILERNEEEEEVHVQVMLLGSEEEAQEVRSRLEAGEDFTTLATDLSRVPGAEDDGGDFGMLPKGMMNPVLDEIAFSPELELETVSQPIRDDTVPTKGGYWLVQVIDKDDDRELEEEDRDLLKIKALSEWIATLWDDPETVVDHGYLDIEKKAWAMEQVGKRQN